MEQYLSRTEGDINIGKKRMEWYDKLDDQTLSALNSDNEHFIHQHLSTPCIDVIVDCEGCYLFTRSGKKILDFHGNNLHQVGYKNSDVINAIVKQINLLPFSPRRFTNLPAIGLASRLTALAPNPLNKVLFAPGGAEVNSIALKIARLVTGRYKIISMWGSFHGTSIDTISVGGEASFSANAGPMLPGIIHIPPPDRYRGLWKDDADLEQYIEYIRFVLEQEGDVGAIIAETVRNTTVHIPPENFWKKIRKLCDRYGALLILDEIPTALGRTGKFFAFEHFDVIPDMVTIGKGLGGAVFPMAAILVSEKLNKVSPYSVGHFTHEKSAVGSAAGIAVLDYIEQNGLIEKAVLMESTIRKHCDKLYRKFEMIGHIRGIGMLWAIELVKDRETWEKAVSEAELIMYECLENGLNFKVSDGNILSLAPPLVIKEAEIESAFQILEKAFEKHLIK